MLYSSWWHTRAGRTPRASRSPRPRPAARQLPRLEALEDRCLPSAAPLTAPDPATRARVEAAYGRLPLSFEANRGQAGAPVQFLARGNGYAVSLAAGGAVLGLGPEAQLRLQLVG